MSVDQGIFVDPRLERATSAYVQDVIAQTARERVWYEGAERFGDIDQLLGAVAAGTLVHVGPSSHVMPIFRLRAPGTETHKPPFLLPSSRAALGAVSRLWREELEELDVAAPELRLAVTSLARTEQMQQALIDDGVVAAPGSTHCVGAAFDLDASGYYRVDLDNGIVSVASPLRDRAGMRRIERALMDQHDNNDTPAQFAEGSEFDATVMTALLVVAQELHDGGYLNRIVEFPDSGNQCLHVCPSPEVSMAEWRSMAQDADARTWMG